MEWGAALMILFAFFPLPAHLVCLVIYSGNGVHVMSRQGSFILFCLASHVGAVYSIIFYIKLWPSS